MAVAFFWITLTVYVILTLCHFAIMKDEGGKKAERLWASWLTASVFVGALWFTAWKAWGGCE